MAGLTIEELAHALGGGCERKIRNGWKTLCPAHEDSRPSLDIEQGHTTIVFNCRSKRCSQEAIIAAMAARGLSLNGKVEPQRPAPRLERTLRHEIKDIDARLIATHIRKEFSDGTKDMPWERDGKPGLGGIPVTSLPLYGSDGLRDIPDGAQVIVAEGEKATEALWKRNQYAVGTVCGAGLNKPPPDDSVLAVLGRAAGDDGLKPLKTVLWPDNDAQGRDHMMKIAASLCAMGHERPLIVDWKDAPPKGDAADFKGTDDELQALLDAAVPYEQPEQPEQPGEPEFGVRADTIKEESVRWVIPGYVARGKLQELIGDPEVSKTTVLLDWCARITTGRGFCDIEIAEGHVGFLSNEDGIADTLMPRLRVAGANLEKVRFFPRAFDSVNKDGEVELTPLVIPEHLPMIEEQIVADGIVFFVIDPVESFFPDKTDTHNNANARKVLAALDAMAERTGCAIISIRHLNKMGSVDRALYRGGGSIAFAAAARVSMIIAPDPTEHGITDDDPQRRHVLATVKNNLAPREPSRAFRKVVDKETIDDDHPKGIVHIEWIDGTVPVVADDLLRPRHKERNSEALTEAVDFLLDELLAGDKPVKEIEEKARQLGISDTTLKRARKKLGVRSRKKGFTGGRLLYLVPKDGVPKDSEPVDGDDDV